MAERRMVSLRVVETDSFVEMSCKAKLLYYELLLRGDDDGFVDSPNTVCRILGINNSKLSELEEMEYIHIFESGVCVILHWHLHNLIRKDRYKPTKYQAEFSALIKLENGIYIPKNSFWQPDDNQMSSQDRLGEYRLGKVSLGEGRIDKVSTQLCENSIKCQDSQLYNSKVNPVSQGQQQAVADTPTETNYLNNLGIYKNVFLTPTQLKDLQERFANYQDKINRLSEYMQTSGKSYSSHYAVILAWAKENTNGKSKGSGKINSGETDRSFGNKSFSPEDISRLDNDIPQI